MGGSDEQYPTQSATRAYPEAHYLPIEEFNRITIQQFLSIKRIFDQSDELIGINEINILAEERVPHDWLLRSTSESIIYHTSHYGFW
ncbi:hypothetical protein TanjilG_18761 [Lupinus angustifolius]|uniref:Uncharacterized protein n=1 Tax=Lupinus angustifolius TaxID=3871 RepID=A0A1J7GCT5_LUPAN|nr:hypothetical protein TanjilG_18761 [Lupinus angustifolius]